MKFLHAIFAPAVLTGALLFAGASSLQAKNPKNDDCRERTARADHRLHEAIEHHGYNSPQAEHARQELRESREYCYNHDHRWWDEDAHQWRNDRNWNDNDHEHWRDDNSH